MRLVHCQVPLEVSRELGVGEGGCHSDRWVPVCSAPENWSARGSVREASAYRAVPQPERQQTSCKSEEPTGKGKEATSMELMAGKSCAGTWARGQTKWPGCGEETKKSER